MNYQIVTLVDKAAKDRGIQTQKELLDLIEEKTGKKLRAATLSDMYSDKGRAINREYFALIAQALEITDIRELITIE